jgi:hypothetical protein
MPHATRREIIEHLNRAGFPITLHGLNHLCANDQGPPALGVWRGQFLYDVNKVLAWARRRFQNGDLSKRGRRRVA